MNAMKKGTQITDDGKLKLSEADVTRQVVDFLLFDGWRPIRMNVGTIPREVNGRIVHTQVGETGMPDYLFLSNIYPAADNPPEYHRSYQQVLWIEFKAPGKKPSAKQREWHEAECDRGGLVKVVDNYEDFKAWYEKTLVHKL